ncbi:MAG: hypothetical protein U0990_06035 [Candidatus Nanopelagicales bacterium]|nr:hypothetical protein [Candidatus Nanopelagicales bacterium]MDZ4249632.1 hypothetical protein [Candidatus Nanopelagicales bacterium]
MSSGSEHQLGQVWWQIREHLRLRLDSGLNGQDLRVEGVSVEVREELTWLEFTDSDEVDLRHLSLE